uniref:Uncharacterized protein n=1 Tax=Oryza nivara TaxID=4536 RepID=A0A0E0JAZ1_ORYNI
MVAPKSCPGDQFACGFVVENTTRQHVVADGRASTNFISAWIQTFAVRLTSFKLVVVVNARDPLFYRCPDLEVANGMVERRVSEDGGGSGAKVDGDGQGIAAADPGRLAWHGSRDNDKRQRKWAANLGGTPPGSCIVLLHISLLSRVPNSTPKFCWLIVMPGWFSGWCCPGFQVQQLPSSKGTGLVFAMLLLLHQTTTITTTTLYICKMGGLWRRAMALPSL